MDDSRRYQNSMNTVIKFKDNLDVFRSIVTIYCNDEGKLFVGNTFKNGTDGWMSVFHKEALPEGEGLIDGWNALDDYLPSMRVVSEERAETGVEDFLYANGAGASWKSVDYNVVNSFSEIEDFCKKNPIQKGSAAAFGIMA